MSAGGKAGHGHSQGSQGQDQGAQEQSPRDLGQELDDLEINSASFSSRCDDELPLPPLPLQAGPSSFEGGLGSDGRNPPYVSRDEVFSRHFSPSDAEQKEVSSLADQVGVDVGGKKKGAGQFWSVLDKICAPTSTSTLLSSTTSTAEPDVATLARAKALFCDPKAVVLYRGQGRYYFQRGGQVQERIRDQEKGHQIDDDHRLFQYQGQDPRNTQPQAPQICELVLFARGYIIRSLTKPEDHCQHPLLDCHHWSDVSYVRRNSGTNETIWHTSAKTSNSTTGTSSVDNSHGPTTLHRFQCRMDDGQTPNAIYHIIEQYATMLASPSNADLDTTSIGWQYQKLFFRPGFTAAVTGDVDLLLQPSTALTAANEEENNEMGSAPPEKVYSQSKESSLEESVADGSVFGSKQDGRLSHELDGLSEVASEEEGVEAMDALSEKEKQNGNRTMKPFMALLAKAKFARPFSPSKSAPNSPAILRLPRIRSSSEGRSLDPQSIAMPTLVSFDTKHSSAFNEIDENWTRMAPLHLAVQQPACSLTVIRALLEGGANPNLSDLDGVSPMKYADLNQVDESILSLLESFGGTRIDPDREQRGELFSGVIEADRRTERRRAVEQQVREAKEAEVQARHAAQEARKALLERGEKIEELGERAQELNQNARTYADLAAQLKAKVQGAGSSSNNKIRWFNI